MPSRFAVTFVDNHDNQRGHGSGSSCIVTHEDGNLHDLANLFLLAHPYGYPKIMSSYYFANADQSPPQDGSGNTSDIYNAGIPTGCNGTDWVCEHRHTILANMVGFRSVTAGEAVTNWWDNGADQIAFGRGGKGYVVLNREGGTLSRTFQTSLPAGDYCNLWNGELNGDGSACTGSTITVNGSGQFTASVNSLEGIAIHIGQKTAPNAVLPTGTSTVAQSGSDVSLGWDHHVNNCNYEIYRSTTPYFDPDVMAPLATVPEPTNTYDVSGDIGDVNEQHYYVIRAVNCNGLHWVDSEEMGEFDFAVVAGTP
jgi:hypothetical protein